jgi:hypothetical protein
VSRSDEPDSREWIPPDDMRSIFEEIERARADIPEGESEAALNHLADAVEALAEYIAGDRGRRG